MNNRTILFNSTNPTTKEKIMGELIDLLDKLADKYKMDSEDVKELGKAIASLKGGKGAQQPADQKEFEYGTEEEPQEEVPMEEEET